MLCQLSGQVPREPVVHRQSGHLYERRLLAAYLEQHGMDPTLRQPATMEDYLVIQCPSVPPPRPPHATSIPALLALLQNEWDAVALATHQHQQQLEATRQELAQALYAQDAAHRVIARLLQERDEARRMLLDMDSVPKESNLKADVEMQEEPAASKEETPEKSGSSLSAEWIQVIDETNQKLSQKRRRRQTPAELATREQLAQLAESETFSLHSSVIHALRLNGPEIWSAGDDKHILGSVNGQVEFTLKGHTKRVLSLALLPSEDSSSLAALLSGSADRVIRIWKVDTRSKSQTYRCAHIVKCHDDQVTSVMTHPSEKCFLSASMDGTWTVMDTEGELLYQSIAQEIEGGFSCAALHPDGVLLATGGVLGTLRIHDVKTGLELAQFHGHSERLTGLDFSENGYILASISDDKTLRLWDLRKLNQVHQVSCKDTPVSVHFDPFGAYLVYATSHEFTILLNKTWQQVFTLQVDEPISQVVFGAHAQSVYVAFQNGQVRVYRPVS